jgi:hypothetical protein
MKSLVLSKSSRGVWQFGTTAPGTLGTSLQTWGGVKGKYEGK